MDIGACIHPLLPAPALSRLFKVAWIFFYVRLNLDFVATPLVSLSFHLVEHLLLSSPNVFGLGFCGLDSLVPINFESFVPTLLQPYRISASIGSFLTIFCSASTFCGVGKLFRNNISISISTFRSINHTSHGYLCQVST